MRIALDGIPLTLQRTGIGNYTFELARGIAQTLPDQHVELVAPSTLAPIQIAETDHPPANLLFRSAKVGAISKRWWSVGLPRYIRKNNIELFHGTNYEVPLWHPCTTVLSIHDFSLLILPQTQQRRRVVRARVRLPIMSRAADVVIVPTEAIKNEACERFKLPTSKVFCVPYAAREFFQPAPPEQLNPARTICC